VYVLYKCVGCESCARGLCVFECVLREVLYGVGMDILYFAI